MLISEHLDVTIVLISAYTNELKCGAKFISSDWPFTTGLEWIGGLRIQSGFVCGLYGTKSCGSIQSGLYINEHLLTNGCGWKPGSVSVACRAGPPPPLHLLNDGTRQLGCVYTCRGSVHGVC
jgi:hypothetical protein